MKAFLIPAFATLIATPVLADAEDFGKLMLEKNGSNATAQTLAVAASALEGDTVDERLPYGDGSIARRERAGPTPGHIRLATEMGVNAEDYTVPELTRMFIDKYD